jgi:hypothetical protein
VRLSKIFGPSAVSAVAERLPNGGRAAAYPNENT